METVCVTGDYDADCSVIIVSEWQNAKKAINQNTVLIHEGNAKTHQTNLVFNLTFAFVRQI